MDYFLEYNFLVNNWLIKEQNFEYGVDDLSTNIDVILIDKNYKKPLLVKSCTPDILVSLCIKDLPIYENAYHVRKNILTEIEAKQIGLSINPRDHYHGLGKDIYMRALDGLESPRVVFKNVVNNNYFIVTNVKDKNNDLIVIPLESDVKTVINNDMLNINRIKTIYGYKKINNISLDDYIKYSIRENHFEKIYEKKEQGTGFSTVASSLCANNISQLNGNVKCNISNNIIDDN